MTRRRPRTLESEANILARSLYELKIAVLLELIKVTKWLLLRATDVVIALTRFFRKGTL